MTTVWEPLEQLLPKLCDVITSCAVPVTSDVLAERILVVRTSGVIFSPMILSAVSAGFICHLRLATVFRDFIIYNYIWGSYNRAYIIFLSSMSEAQRL